MYQYADNTHLYLLMDSQLDPIPKHLAGCLEAEVGLLKQSHLKWNPSKPEVLWLGWGLSQGIQLPALGRVQLVPASSVRSLGVILDASLSLEAHVTKMARMAFFDLCQAQQLIPADCCSEWHSCY